MFDLWYLISLLNSIKEFIQTTVYAIASLVPDEVVVGG
jgi:hypothetical protein